MKYAPWTFVLLTIFFQACKQDGPAKLPTQPVHTDVAFVQDYSIKYGLAGEGITLKNVVSDRNGVIQVFSSAGLLKPFAGSFLYPGTLVVDRTYRPLADKKIKALEVCEHQFVYVDDKAVLSNAWAGELYMPHTLPTVTRFKGNREGFLLSDGQQLEYVKNGKSLWKEKHAENILDMAFDETTATFWLLTANSLQSFSTKDQTLKTVFLGKDLTSFALTGKGKEAVIGTREGYVVIDLTSATQKGERQTKLPWTEITCVRTIGDDLWFGTTRGAFKIRHDGKFDHYASKRWLPSDLVVDIAEGPEGSILILTDQGLGQIVLKKMTLHEKADYFERQVRARHIRHGFNATLGYMKDGSLATGSLEDSDNDGLWTSMYLGAEVFRYAVTKSDDALQNIREATEAMERLYSINDLKGFPSRSFERRGYKYDDKPWRRAGDPEWDWKSTTSSDEAIGHIFAFGVMAELLDDQDLKHRAVTLIDSLMQHVLDNNLYLVDWDGKPTVWGKWNPDYVNQRPFGVGDRKINSSNIIAMLQTAYHFTKKEAYKTKAFELLDKHGYFKNLMYPMSKIGMAAPDADDWSKMLSEAWNHSDDEMYFVGYWGLYRYAFNDTLKTRYKESIIDHWQAERPEKEGAWNIFTALTGTPDFDLNEAVWYLQEYPLDLIHWKVSNEHRRDIERIEPNFRKQTIRDVLPPDELPINRHNANRFDLDGGDDGASEYSAGDIWLLPYWMGRYLGVISAPVEK
ncbi:hypothetical protein SAMN04488109_1993 [Chryseolinea serpens]|uniref:Uncharacterized protein n=1 Tax=Chryseolinea serpens TaxID=947013 RepID=A0A1M5MYE5_9BACT|nr:hypothetical protein [Chryseolinea serpens]SHG81949.1 hypothetical protein SAMN04488109_1993 [Chryseolinea serpens]